MKRPLYVVMWCEHHQEYEARTRGDTKDAIVIGAHKNPVKALKLLRKDLKRHPL